MSACQAPLDEQAILTAMVYVDLNPIRAQMAQTPEDSEHTSVAERIAELKPARHRKPRTLPSMRSNQAACGASSQAVTPVVTPAVTPIVNADLKLTHRVNLHPAVTRWASCPLRT